MTKLSMYNIPFKGLGLGAHKFDYQIGSSFFELFDDSIVDDVCVRVEVCLEKGSAITTIRIALKGTVRVVCDRCLELYDQPVKSENTVFVKTGEKTFDEGDDVVWVAVNDHQVNVAKLINDYIILAIPIRQVHPADKEGSSTCDPDMMTRLKSLSFSGDENKEEEPDKIDPRWKDLKKLLENK